MRQAGAMPPRQSAPVAPIETEALRPEIADLRSEVRELKQSIGVLIDVMNDVREELAWLTRNEIPRCEVPLAVSPVLKQMALDPCDPTWGEKLVIARGEPKERRFPESSVPPAPASDSEPSAPLLREFEPGDAVEFDYFGERFFGELLSVDPGRSEAAVLAIGSGEEVIVPLDDLTRVEPDPDEAEPE